jgi:hypothetical protein
MVGISHINTYAGRERIRFKEEAIEVTSQARYARLVCIMCYAALPSLTAKKVKLFSAPETLFHIWIQEFRQDLQ